MSLRAVPGYRRWYGTTHLCRHLPYFCGNRSFATTALLRPVRSYCDRWRLRDAWQLQRQRVRLSGVCDVGHAGAACQFSDNATCYGNGVAQEDGSCACAGWLNLDGSVFTADYLATPLGNACNDTSDYIDARGWRCTDWQCPGASILFSTIPHAFLGVMPPWGTDDVKYVMPARFSIASLVGRCWSMLARASRAFCAVSVYEVPFWDKPLHWDYSVYTLDAPRLSHRHTVGRCCAKFGRMYSTKSTCRPLHLDLRADQRS